MTCSARQQRFEHRPLQVGQVVSPRCRYARHEVSGVKFWLGRLNQIPETSSVIDHRHAATSTLYETRPSAGTSLVAEFLGTDLERVQAGTVHLRAMGLLTADGFPHEQTRLAVLASVPQEELSALRARAAELLYRGG